MFQELWIPRWVRSYRLMLHKIYFLYRHQERLMNDFSKLDAAVADLTVKVDTLLTTADVQPQIDAAEAAITALANKVAPTAPVDEVPVGPA